MNFILLSAAVTLLVCGFILADCYGAKLKTLGWTLIAIGIFLVLR